MPKITNDILNQIIREEIQGVIKEKGFMGKALGALGSKAKAVAGKAAKGVASAAKEKAVSAAGSMKDKAIADQAVKFLKDKPELAKYVIDALSDTAGEAGNREDY